MTFIFDIVNIFFTFLFEIIIAFFNIILSPLDVLVSTAFPYFSTASDYINSMIDTISPYFSFIISIFGLPPFVISYVCFCIIISLTGSLSIWTVKLAIKWISKFKGGS